MTSYSAELGWAKEIAALGAEVAMAQFRRRPVQHLKNDGSWVTDADRASEKEMRRLIRERWPEHNILGEEEGFSPAGGNELHSEPTWVLDPIDGTNNYIAGIQLWATLVALRIGNHNVVGVVHAPALGEVYDAAEGVGARLNGAGIAVDPLADLSRATVALPGAEVFARHRLEDFHRELVDRAWRSRGFGDFWGHMLVARGSAHVMVEPELCLWDVAALEVIVAEAGGRTSHLDGTRWVDRGSALTTNGALHDEVLALALSTRPDTGSP